MGRLDLERSTWAGLSFRQAPSPVCGMARQPTSGQPAARSGGPVGAAVKAPHRTWPPFARGSTS
jgi:hypothetical protein